MNIYFAGSIRGGRQDVALYAQIVEHLKQYGKVLTEHVGDPQLTGAEAGTLSDERIYARDHSWMVSADVVIAEVTTPSLGVGMELAWAIVLGKKAICLYRPQSGKRLSALVAGSPLKVREYETIDEAMAILDGFLAKKR